MTASPALDHIVVNAMCDLETVAACFVDLGFQLTPLGRHSLGSINHLMMTPGAYLELVGVPATGLQRPDVLSSPLGLNGLVLASADAEATLARLTEAGHPGSRLLAFSRPVDIDGQLEDARFRTVRLPSATFPAGRVYFCEHLTPGLVWREPWFHHPNGFCGIDRLVVTSPDPAEDARRYASLCGQAAEPMAQGARIRLGAFTLDVVGGAEPRFSRLGLRFTDLDEIDRRACALPAVRWHREHADSAMLTLPALDFHIACRSAG